MDDDVEAACSRAEADVWVANHNAPGQVVIAGVPDAVDAAGRIAKDLGAKRVLPITVGGAFHTPLMSSARDRLRKALSQVEWRDADRPVAANVDARLHTTAEEWAPLLDTAAKWYRGAPFEAVQLLWPDRNGFLPYEAGFEHRMRLAQPVIGTLDEAG